MLLHIKDAVVNPDDSINIEVKKAATDKAQDVILTVTQKNVILKTMAVSFQQAETSKIVQIPVSSLGLVNGGVCSVNLYDVRTKQANDPSASSTTVGAPGDAMPMIAMVYPPIQEEGTFEYQIIAE